MALSIRPLFGGTIEMSVPTTYHDASDMRQVPNTQEVFLSHDSETSVVIEILEVVEEGGAKEDLREAIKFHFNALAHDNEALSSNITSSLPSQPVPPTIGTYISSTLHHIPTPQPIFLTGTQSIRKYRSNRPVEDLPPPDDVVIMLALWRVELHGENGKRRADVVCSANVNVGKDGQQELESVRSWWEPAMKEMRIKDYALFQEVSS